MICCRMVNNNAYSIAIEEAHVTYLSLPMNLSYMVDCWWSVVDITAKSKHIQSLVLVQYECRIWWSVVDITVMPKHIQSLILDQYVCRIYYSF